MREPAASPEILHWRGVKSLDKAYEYKGEKFTIQETSQCSLVVKDDKNVVTISVASGNYNVRRSDGWGSWQTDLTSAVNAACRLLVESRADQKSKTDRCAEIHDFVKAL